MSIVLRSLPRRAANLTSIHHPSPRQASRAVKFIPTPFPIYARKMSDITHVLAEGVAAPAGPYSHAIKTPTAIYCSGQVHLDAAGNLVGGTIGEKTAVCISNLKAVLTAAGSSLDRVVKVNIFLADMASFAEVNKEYEKWFTQKPARACVAVKQLPLKADVEIECTALP